MVRRRWSTYPHVSITYGAPFSSTIPIPPAFPLRSFPVSLARLINKWPSSLFSSMFLSMARSERESGTGTGIAKTTRDIAEKRDNTVMMTRMMVDWVTCTVAGEFVVLVLWSCYRDYAIPLINGRKWSVSILVVCGFFFGVCGWIENRSHISTLLLLSMQSKVQSQSLTRVWWRERKVCRNRCRPSCKRSCGVLDGPVIALAAVLSACDGSCGLR